MLKKQKKNHLKGKQCSDQCVHAHSYSLRALYGTDNKENALHASDSQETAARELAFFFPKFQVPGSGPTIQRTLALIRPSALEEHKGTVALGT